jgi:hypothetical protein
LIVATIEIVCRRRWHSVGAGRIVQTMDNRFDQTDFSVVVKKRAPLPKPWKWEIIGPVERAQ